MGARSINGSKRPCRGAAERSRSLRKSPFAVLSGRPAACRQAARPGVPQPGRERPLAPTAPGLRVPRGQHRHAPPRGLLLGSTDFSATHRNKQRDEPPCSHAGKLAEEQRRVRTQRDLSNPHQKYKQQQKKGRPGGGGRPSRKLGTRKRGVPAPRPAAGVRLPPPAAPAAAPRASGPGPGVMLPARGTARLPAPGPAQEGRPPGVNGRHGRAGREESSGFTWISAGLVEPRRRRRRRLQVPAAHPSAPRHVSGVTPPAPRLLADFPPFFPPPAPPPARWRGQPSGTPARTAAACLPSAPAPGPPHFLTGNSR